MARVVVFTADLMFGSRVHAQLVAAGHTVDLLSDPAALPTLLTSARVLIVDLTDEDYGGLSLMESLSSQESLSLHGSLAGVGTLAFYSHVDVQTRVRAEGAGFDMVVPRSRMAREGAALVAKLVQARDQRASR
jgi:hypothetical protein